MSSGARIDEWGLKAAEQLESTVGAWVALASYKRLFEAAPPIQARAMLGALRCAASLRDEKELDQLVERWSRADAALATLEPIALARAELARGQGRTAASLVRAELARRPAAHTAYAAARILEGARGTTLVDTAGSWRLAQTLALSEGAVEIAGAAAARRLEMLEAASSLPGTPYRSLATEIVAAVEPGALKGTPRLLVARARLLMPGRFTRAGALSALADLVTSGPAALAQAAGWAIARHVDAMGARISSVEGERALAGLRALPEGPHRDGAVKRATAVIAVSGATGPRREEAARAAAGGDVATSELATRARAIDEGPPSARVGRERFADLFSRLAALGVEALGAIAHQRLDLAIDAMDAAWQAVGPGEAIPAPLWAAASAGLAARGEVRARAAKLAEALVERAAGEPPTGFTGVGLALAAAGAPDAALTSLRFAARARETGGGAALARVAASCAWRAHQRGEADRALALLVEAREAAGAR